MYDKYQYSNAYFNLHDNHVMNTVADVVKTTLDVTDVFVHNNRTVSVYVGDNFNYSDLCTVVDLFGDAVHDVDVGGFFDDCYVLYFKVALVDADD